MSSSVCQGLQSCLELRLVESRFLRLKLAPPITNFPGSIPSAPCFTSPGPTEPKLTPNSEEKNTAITHNKKNVDDCKLIGNQNVDVGGWSFLQSLANASGSNSSQHDKVYVHPLVKRSASTLSEKSLEMCTESLGSETGIEASELNDDISLLSSETGVCNPSKPRESLATRKTSRVNSFPPPLSSISGSNGVKVKSHREGGRLILQAVSIPPYHSYFHAERGDGRLRLSLLKDATPIFHNEDGEEEDQEEETVEKDDEDDEDEEVKDELRIWKEIVGMLGLKLGQGSCLGQAAAKKVGVGTKACLIGSHSWWGGYLKAKGWKIFFNPKENYCYWIP